jgi:hypothetical protein
VPSPAGAARGCFAAHLWDAAQVNADRAPGYARLSEGRSWWLSAQLIGAEVALLPLALSMDLLAEATSVRDDVGLCDLFEPMSEAPPQRVVRATRPLGKPAVVDASLLARTLSRAHDTSLASLALAAEVELARLDSPRFNCMTRHMLESVRRSALVASRSQRANEREVLGLMVDLHLAGMRRAVALDEGAAALQREGVSIVCDDVPHIPRAPSKHGRMAAPTRTPAAHGATIDPSG